MPELNADVPITYCYLRSEYLYNLKKGHGARIACAVFGISSIPSRALGFHCMLDNGAVIYRLPISAFVHRDGKLLGGDFALELLELWDCFSSNVTVQEYSFLRNLRCSVILKNRVVIDGIYCYTVDWYGSSLADNPGEGGHKCAHIIALANGQYAAQPNNRIRWHEPSFATARFPVPCDYETNNHVWSVENKGPKWVTENTDRLFYDITNAKTSAPEHSRKATRAGGKAGDVQGVPSVRVARRARMGRRASKPKDSVRR